MYDFVCNLNYFTEDGKEHLHQIERSRTFDELDAVIVNDDELFSLTVKPSSSSIIFSRVEAIIKYIFSPSDKLFLNGYQSWTFSHEHNTTDKEKEIGLPEFLIKKYGLRQYGDYTFTKRLNMKGNLHGFTYAYIRRDKEYDFFGSVNERSGFTEIRFDVHTNSIIFTKDCEGKKISGGTEHKLLEIYNAHGSENEVFDDYFHKYLHIAPPRATHKIGYTSWYNHYQNINEQVLERDLDGLCSLPIKADIFQIDDGYQNAIGDWLITDKTKFPSDMKSFADKIKAKGFIPGIWLAPFVCESKSELIKNHPDWLLRDADGEKVYCGCNWSGFYALDFYNNEVREYLKNVFNEMIKRGYELFKLDFLYAVCLIPQHNKTRGEIMFEAMDFLREIIGDKLILGCGVPLAAAFGTVDYCRIGPDISLEWDGKLYMHLLHGERPSTKSTMLNSLYRRQLSGRAFLNDTDVLILRDENTKLKWAQKEALSIVNGLCGGLLFASDNFGDYDEKKLAAFIYAVSLKDAEITNIEHNKKCVTISYELSGNAYDITFKL